MPSTDPRPTPAAGGDAPTPTNGGSPRNGNGRATNGGTNGRSNGTATATVPVAAVIESALAAVQQNLAAEVVR